MKEDVPVMYVPAPPVIDRPDLPISEITSTTSAGDIAKMYVASVKALEDYSSQLEAVIADYKNKHDQTQVIADQVKQGEKQ